MPLSDARLRRRTYAARRARMLRAVVSSATALRLTGCAFAPPRRLTSTAPGGSRPASARLRIVVPRAVSASTMAAADAGGGWISLGTSAKELRLDNTLPTGQSFRWRKTTEGDYVGVIGQRVVSMRQAPDDVLYRVHCRPSGETAGADDAAAVADYFNLGVSLETLSAQWAAADERFRRLEPHLPGCRMLRQDPAECLFSFICSSNNHISRIHGMVERLCAAYGTRLEPDDRVRAMLRAVPTPKRPTPKKKRTRTPDDAPSPSPSPSPSPAPSPATAPEADEDPPGEPLGDFYAFPTVAQLRDATEEALRGMGFGYRAKFIAGSAAALEAKDGGADAHLAALRGEKSYREAQAALGELPGVGPKVAACVCLFSLDKHEAIPVDTHVWQLAVEHYTPNLEGKSLTPRVMMEVEEAIVGVFGAYAGWAHNTLFVAELAHVRAGLPEELRTPPRPKSAKKPKREKKEDDEKRETEEAKKKDADEKRTDDPADPLASPAPVKREAEVKSPPRDPSS